MPGRGSSRRDVSVYSLGAEVALCVLLVGTPLAFAGAPVWTLWPLAGLSATAFALSMIGAARQRQSLEVAPVVLILVTAVFLCALQLIPLPPGVLSVVSPEAAALREFALVPLGLEGARPISLDPPGTWRELARHVAYAFVALSAIQVARSRHARRRLIAALAASGVLVTLIGLGHLLFRADTLFGAHGFEGGVSFVTTFGNSNHLAAFLTLTAAAALALAAAAEDRARVMLWALMFISSGVGALLSLSRGGIVFFLVAPVLFVALVALRRRDGAESVVDPSTPGSWANGRRGPERRRWVLLAAVVGTVTVIAAGAYVAWEQLATELSSVDSMEKLRASKVTLWPSFVDAATHFWRAGMGRGAFEAGFTPYQTQHPELTFTHPENVVFQLVTELGLIGAALLVALSSWTLLRILRRRETGAPELALIAGVIAVVLHDQLDFALELPGTALAAIVAVCLATRGSDDRPLMSLSVPRGAVAGLVALALLGGALAGGRSTLRGDEARLAEVVKAGKREAIEAAALAAIDRHPAHYAFYDVLMRLETDPKAGRPERALAYANRSLYLRPSGVEAHWLAARALLKLGKRSQAFLEYRLAYEGRLGSDKVLDDALRFARGADELRRIVPNHPDDVSNLVAQLRVRRRIVEADAVLAAAIDELSDHPRVGELWALRAAHKLEQQDAHAALSAIDEAAKRTPDDRRIAIQRAAILSALGRREDAVSALEALSRQHPDDVEVAFALVGQLLGGGRNSMAREALARVSPFVGASHERVRLLSLEASSYEAEGRSSRALQSYESASRLDPQNPSLQLAMARLSESLGRYENAEKSIRAAIASGGDGDGSLKAWLARLEAKAMARQLDREKRLLEPATEARQLE